MGVCKDEMKKLINGEVEKVHIISQFESMDNISTAVQVWEYDKEKDIISYCTITKTNVKKPYFIKIKNGANFVDKKYVGESLTDDTKLTLTTKDKVFEMLEKLKLSNKM